MTVEGNKRARTLSPRFDPVWFSAALVLGLSIAVLWSFVQPLLWALVIAVASWPMYRRFGERMPRSLASSATPLIFTTVISLLVLAPIVFAFGTLAIVARSWADQIALANQTGFAVPAWVEGLPLVGAHLAEHWRAQLSAPGGMMAWVQHFDTNAVLGWAQTLGQFAGRHLFRICFTILVLFFLYRNGESVAGDFTGFILDRFGDRGRRHIELAARAVRATVGGTLVVCLFDGVLGGIAYALAGVPHAEVWGALTGLFAAIPFLGYAAVAGAAAVLAIQSSAVAASIVVAAGVVILFVGDKVVRPILVGNATQLGFVWVLMGSLGGVELMGLLGLFIGPVVLTLAADLWRERAGKRGAEPVAHAAVGAAE